MAKHGPRISEDAAIASVAGIRYWSETKAKEPLRDLARFAGSRTLDELESFAAKARKAQGGTIPRDDGLRRCPHGEWGGEVVLAGERRCYECEQANPASERAAS